jgi:hypothetical protein
MIRAHERVLSRTLHTLAAGFCVGCVQASSMVGKTPKGPSHSNVRRGAGRFIEIKIRKRREVQPSRKKGEGDDRRRSEGKKG